MITLRRTNERGQTKLNSLDSRHTFSFGDYYDPQHMSFGELRVVNEDRGVSFDDPWDPHRKPLGRNPLGQLWVVGSTVNFVRTIFPTRHGGRFG
jgi:hypothetical protein